jgi:nicotinamidase/pyrazinamidase
MKLLMDCGRQEMKNIWLDPDTLLPYPPPPLLFLQEWAKSYTKALEDKGRFVLCIWPEHCLIGTNGHNVFPPVNDALQAWAATNLKTVDYVQKGENCLTEMYSAISAEVPVDGAGSFNTKLYQDCVNTDKVRLLTVILI